MTIVTVNVVLFTLYRILMAASGDSSKENLLYVVAWGEVGTSRKGKGLTYGPQIARLAN